MLHLPPAGTCKTRLLFMKKITAPAGLNTPAPLTLAYHLDTAGKPRWHVQLRGNTLVFTDIDGMYGPPATPHLQNTGDFYAHGPHMPLPDSRLKSELLRAIATGDTFNPAQPPFTRFDYPDHNGATPPAWHYYHGLEIDFVTVKNYGIEFGTQHLKNGLLDLGFCSFEKLWHEATPAHRLLRPELLTQIRHFLAIFANGARGIPSRQ